MLVQEWNLPASHGASKTSASRLLGPSPGLIGYFWQKPVEFVQKCGSVLFRVVLTVLCVCCFHGNVTVGRSPACVFILSGSAATPFLLLCFLELWRHQADSRYRCFDLWGWGGGLDNVLLFRK